MIANIINVIFVVFGMVLALFVGYDMGFQDAKKKFGAKE
jgi:hypothetical protein